MYRKIEFNLGNKWRCALIMSVSYNLKCLVGFYINFYPFLEFMRLA